jgi:two-component system sensor histidine kinase YesM
VTGAIDDLIQLFRLTTQIQGEYITIEEDLHIIRLYCEILMIRYMDCFTVEYEVDETLLSCKTIKFLLQPLLENAIYHGFQDWKKNALIRISVREEEGDVVFEVFDNGCGMDAETILRVLTLKKEDGKGLNKIGVNNVNMRIRRCFGEEYGLSFESEPGHYTIARAKIPKLVMEGR